MSRLRRRTPPALLTAAVLVGLLAGCGADNPPGTLGEDDLPSSVEVKGRIVIVSITRTGDDEFSVLPEDLLDRAVTVSAQAPK